MSAAIACSHCHQHADGPDLTVPPGPRGDSQEGENTLGSTVADLIGPFLKERLAQGIYTHDRARGARSTLYGFADFCGKRRITNIGAPLVESWLMSMEHLAPATRRDRLSTVRMLFAWAVKRGHCKRNPASEVAGPRQPRTIPRAMAGGDIARVLDECPDARAVLIVVLLVQQGLRCCEVSRLTMGDIDWTHRTMRVVGKGGHERILPITDETAGALTVYLNEHPASAGPLVRSYRQNHRALTADTISGLVAEWMWAAGVKKRARDGISAHAGRHTAATDMLLAGAHLRDVQAALGHAHLQTTERYLPYVVKGLAEAMEGRQYRVIPPQLGTKYE